MNKIKYLYFLASIVLPAITIAQFMLSASTDIMVAWIDVDYSDIS